LSSRSVKALAAATIIAVAALAAYWYGSPFLVIRQMQAAAEARDADAFNRHVDYPVLRESLTQQIADKVGVRMGGTGEDGKPVAAIGSILATALVGPLVDRLVSPRVVMRAMQEGYLGPRAAQAGSPAPQTMGKPGETSGADSAARPLKRRWSYERIGFDELVARAIDPNQDPAQPEDPLVLVFQRSGFADWKLTDIRIPALNT
jgi:hypothetical protein